MFPLADFSEDIRRVLLMEVSDDILEPADGIKCVESMSLPLAERRCRT